MGDLDHVEAGRPAPSLEAVAKWNRRIYRAHQFRLVLLVAWIAMAVCFPLFGAEKSDLRDLLDDIDQGQVAQVTIEGPGLSATEDGSAEQFVRWRDGLYDWHWRYVRVEVSTEPDLPALQREDGEWHLSGRDVGAYLSEQAPHLSLTRHDDVNYDVSVLAGWRVPNWLGIWVFVVQLLVFLKIVGGPEPLRATRWAWFWLFLLPPGGLAYLALSGPTPFVPPPRNKNWRLTGGWAFLICLFLGGLDSGPDASDL